MPATQPLIPKGYTFNNPKEFISVNAKRLLLELLDKSDQRDPDTFGIYVYNDFFGYGVLDLVDKTLAKLHARIVKKDWDEAMPVLEALTIFQEMLSGIWMGVDDGEHIEMTVKAYGASLVTIIRRLTKEGKLDEEHFPSLENILRGASEWCKSTQDLFDVARFDRVCNGVARRLFPYRDRKRDAAAYDARVALEKARVAEWIAGLTAEEKEEANAWLEKPDDDDDEDEDKEDDPDKPWYGGPKDGDEDDDDEDYVLSRVWREYRQHVGGLPLKGPPNWDISKWTEAQRKQFKFGGSDDEQDGPGFFF